MVTDVANVTIIITQEMMYGLLFGIFIFDLGLSFRATQGHNHFDCEYLIDNDRYVKHNYSHEI